MLRLYTTAVLFLLSAIVFAQPRESRYTDSLKKKLSGAKTDYDRMNLLAGLSMASFADPALAEKYMSQAVAVAEMSRDRRLMAMAYLVKGNKYLNAPGLSDNLERAIANFTRVEELARTNNLQVLQVMSYKKLARAMQLKGDHQKALFYSNQALSTGSNSDNDTARVNGYISMGSTYLQMNEKLLSFRNFLEALNVAEKSGDESLLKEAYNNLSDFYASIKAYDTAIDYRMRVYQMNRKAWDVSQIISGDYEIGDLFWRNKQQDMALKMYEHAIQLADSLHYDLFKWDPYFRIFNMYFNNAQFIKALDYLQEHPSVLVFLQNAGYQFFIDELMAMSHVEKGRFDSAAYYFRRAEPDVERKANPEGRYDFYNAYAYFFTKKKDFPQAIVYNTKAYEVGEQVNDMDWQLNSARDLDSIYSVTGDFKRAHFYNVRYHLLRDSIQELGRETELRKMEVENENQRRERLAKEEEVKIEHRHNVQYLGFTIGLVVLFILLVMLGWLSVPANFIRALGFVSFIFLFEFIILLADKQIAHWTHEEPWKVLMIKIGLAAILVPLHHWLEHKVIHYLSHRKKQAHSKEVHSVA